MRQTPNPHSLVKVVSIWEWRDKEADFIFWIQPLSRDHKIRAWAEAINCQVDETAISRPEDSGPSDPIPVSMAGSLPQHTRYPLRFW